MPTTYSTTMLPDLIGQDYDARRVFQTLRTPPETAADQTRPMSGTNILWTFKLGWQALTLSGAEQLLHGFEFLGGPTHGMYWYEWLSQGWLGIPIGTGDGTNKVFTLPVKGAATGTTTVRVNNVAAGGTFTTARARTARTSSRWPPLRRPACRSAPTSPDDAGGRCASPPSASPRARPVPPDSGPRRPNFSTEGSDL